MWKVLEVSGVSVWVSTDIPMLGRFHAPSCLSQFFEDSTPYGKLCLPEALLLSWDQCLCWQIGWALGSLVQVEHYGVHPAGHDPALPLAGHSLVTVLPCLWKPFPALSFLWVIWMTSEKVSLGALGIFFAFLMSYVPICGCFPKCLLVIIFTEAEMRFAGFCLFFSAPNLELVLCWSVGWLTRVWWHVPCGRP